MKSFSLTRSTGRTGLLGLPRFCFGKTSINKHNFIQQTFLGRLFSSYSLMGLLSGLRRCIFLLFIDLFYSIMGLFEWNLSLKGSLYRRISLYLSTFYDLIFLLF